MAEIDLNTLPAPLNRLQALSLGRAADLKILFEALISQFGFGKISSFKASNITSRIPKYQQVQVKEIDLNDRRLYSGKYSGYSNEELIEIIDTHLFLPDYEKYGKFNTIYQGREDLIFNGKLLHFRQIDREIELPPGTARALVVPVAERYDLEPALLTDNVVRFRDAENNS